MLIIDRNKDFYDHFSRIYGEDKKVVYDRRGSILLDDEYFFSTIKARTTYDHLFCFIVEIGYTQSIVCFKNVKIQTICTKLGFSEDRVVSFELITINTFKNQKHLFSKPVTIAAVNTPSIWSWKYTKQDTSQLLKKFPLSEFRIRENTIQENPIIANTMLTSVLDPFEVWKDISTYISSQANDKDVDILNSDKDKIVSHGFDTKTSFRNPIK